MPDRSLTWSRIGARACLSKRRGVKDFQKFWTCSVASAAACTGFLTEIDPDNTVYSCC